MRQQSQHVAHRAHRSRNVLEHATMRDRHTREVKAGFGEAGELLGVELATAEPLAAVGREALGE